jgi:hypothetical protein
MIKQEETVPACQFCGGAVEIGCLMGKDNLFGFQWYEGDPSFWKNIMPHGEPLGETDLLSGTYLKGGRCQSCRKVVLDY